MKFFVFLSLLLFLSFTCLADGEVNDSCTYKSELEQCIQANKDGVPRSIEDFICISSNNKYEILPQIILDKEFKKIDKEAESYLQKLEDNKSEFFGQGASRSLIEAVDEVELKFGTSEDDGFGKKYMELCGVGIIAKTIDCFGGVPDTTITPYFNTETCKYLVKTKLEVFKSVSYDILKLNKSQVARDEKKKNTQKRRGKYDKLLEIIMVNVGYMERIWKKWPSKTKQ